MFKSNFTGTKRSIARVVIAAVCILIAVYQLVAGLRMINENDNKQPDVTSADFDSFAADDVVQGTVDSVFDKIYDESGLGETALNLYYARSGTGRIIIFRAAPDSEMDRAMSELLEGKSESVSYKGKVKQMTDAYETYISNNVSIKKLSKKYTFEGYKELKVSGLMIDPSPYDAGYTEKAIIATFAGAVIMVILAFLFMFRLFKDAYIAVAASKGKYKPEMKVTKNDITFEMQGMYEGNDQYGEDFFVNTEYNIRDYGSTKNNSKADRSQLPSTKDDAALNRNEKGEAIFYTDSVNDEGNFYVDSQRQNNASRNSGDMTKRY